MSVGSFYIMITKLLEQRKIMSQYNKTVRNTFWRAANLREGATKLDKNGAWRQVVDDALKASDEHGKMGDRREAHDWMHGSLQRRSEEHKSELQSIMRISYAVFYLKKNTNIH